MAKIGTAVREFFKHLILPETEIKFLKEREKGLSDWVEQISRATFYVGALDSASKLTRPYEQHPTVYIAVSRIARNISKVEIEFYREGAKNNDRPVENHWAKDLLLHPSDEMSGMQLREWTLVNLELKGEAFWLPVDSNFGPAGQPKYIDQVDPDIVSYEVEGRKIIWKANSKPRPSMRQFKYVSPYDPIRGLAPWKPIAYEAEADYAALLWNKRFFQKGAIPSGIMKLPQGITPNKESRDAFREEWRNLYGGEEQRSIAVIGGGAEFQDLSKTQRDAEFNLLRRFSREQILAAFDVPPAVAGVFEYANYANSKAQIEYFWLNNLLPKLSYLKDRIDLFLRSYRTGLVCFFKEESIMALIENMLEKTEAAERLFHMGFPPTDINERLELGFDTDDKPWLSEGWLALNVLPASSFGEAREAGPTEPSAPKSLEPEIRDDLVRSAEWHKIITLPTELERGLRDKIKKVFYQLRTETLRNLETLNKTVADLTAEIKSWRDLNKAATFKVHKESGALYCSHDTMMTAKVTETAQAVAFNVNVANKKLTAVIMPYTKSAVKKGGEAILSEAGIEIDFDYLDPEVTEFLRTKENEIKGIGERMWGRLVGELSAGFAAGETITELGERIRSVFRVSESRSLTIARTETMEAFNSGRFHGYTQAYKRGIEKDIQWLSSRDARVRDSHRREDGHVVAYGNTFPITHLRYPADPRGRPEEIVNCRCTFNISRKRAKQ